MTVITKINVCKNKSNGITANITVANVERFSQANQCKETHAVKLSMLDLFKLICNDELVFTKQCNKGFWFLNREILFNEAAKQNIKLSSAESYFKAASSIFFETYGELYNGFIERWENFTANKRKVVKEVF